MNDEIVVRLAESSDQGPADRLVNAVFPDDPHAYAENIRVSDGCINVVADSSQVGLIGFASLLVEASPHLGTQEWRKYALYIGVVAVDPGYRRRSICTRMLDLLMVTAQTKAPYQNFLHLHVHQDNEPAIKCFERFGFERAGEVGPDKKGRKSWLMRKDIRQSRLTSPSSASATRT